MLSLFGYSLKSLQIQNKFGKIKIEKNFLPGKYMAERKKQNKDTKFFMEQYAAL